MSIIVPLYNEEESVVALHRAVSAAVSRLGLTYEILFVDDGSDDNTVAQAREIAATDPHLKLILFRRNFGQTPAMAAGIDYARGDILVTMDGDLQNDPADIPLLVEQIHAGFDIVVGWRHKRRDNLITRKIPSRMANWLIGKVTGVPIKDNGCSLKAYRADVIKHIPLYSEMHRFIPAMASISGARVAQIRVRHHARAFGQSKYGISRVYKVLLDLLGIKTVTAFASRPLVWFSKLAFPLLIISASMIGYSVYALASSGTMPIPVAGVGLLLGTLAAFLLMSGVLGELIYRTGNLDLGRLAMLTMDRHPGPEAAGSVHDVERRDERQ
nr:glycosyltransferase family 2 protein [Methylonatrum kenyense]